MKSDPCKFCFCKPLMDDIRYYQLQKRLLKSAIGEKIDHELLLFDLLPPEEQEEKVQLISNLRLLYYYFLN